MAKGVVIVWRVNARLWALAITSLVTGCFKPKMSAISVINHQENGLDIIQLGVCGFLIIHYLPFDSRYSFLLSLFPADPRFGTPIIKRRGQKRIKQNNYLDYFSGNWHTNMATVFFSFSYQNANNNFCRTQLREF